MKILSAPFIFPISDPPLKEGGVVVDESAGTILAVGPLSQLASEYPHAEKEDFPHHLLMPGLVNAQTRLELLSMEGSTSHYFDWVEAVWNEQHRITPLDRRHRFEEGIRQLLSCGTTCIGDVGHYSGLLPQLERSCLRMVLFPELLQGVGEEYESFFSQVDEIQALRSSKISSGFAPFSAYTLSRHLLKIVSQQAITLKAPLQIRVAETFAEMQFFYESTGEIAERIFPRMGWGKEEDRPFPHRQTPVQYLDRIGFLDASPSLSGCNHLSELDVEIMAKKKVKVVHSPRRNNHFKLGLPPLKKLRFAGIPVALGTDGLSSLFSLSLWDEMRYMRHHYEECPSPEDLLKMATLEGAKALGLETSIGSLEPGKKADLIAVRIPPAELKNLSLNNLPAWLVDHTTPQSITAVFVGGEKTP